jgi:hypothetical protein
MLTLQHWCSVCYQAHYLRGLNSFRTSTLLQYFCTFLVTILLLLYWICFNFYKTWHITKVILTGEILSFSFAENIFSFNGLLFGI